MSHQWQWGQLVGSKCVGGDQVEAMPGLKKLVALYEWNVWFFRSQKSRFLHKSPWILNIWTIFKFKMSCGLIPHRPNEKHICIFWPPCFAERCKFFGPWLPVNLGSGMQVKTHWTVSLPLAVCVHTYTNLLQRRLVTMHHVGQDITSSLASLLPFFFIPGSGVFPNT